MKGTEVVTPEPPADNIFLSPFSDSSTSWWTQGAVTLQWGLPPTLSCIATTRGSCESWGELKGRTLPECSDREGWRKTSSSDTFFLQGPRKGEEGSSDQER